MLPSSQIVGFFRPSLLPLFLLLLAPFPALAHEGHVLDIVSALMEPLAGWDHLLMALMFLAVLALGLRIAIKALGRQRRSDAEDPS